MLETEPEATEGTVAEITPEFEDSALGDEVAWGDVETEDKTSAE